MAMFADGRDHQELDDGTIVEELDIEITPEDQTEPG